MEAKRPVKIDGSTITKEQVEQDKYRKKCKRIKRLIKDLVYENGALCDQIAILQEKTLHMIDERNYLFKKLYTYQPISKSSADSDLMAIKAQVSSMSSENLNQSKKPVAKKKTEIILSNQENQNKSGKPVKKPIQIKKKKPVKTISLDPLGKPIFPIKLGELTIHSIGEVSDRPQYRTDEVIFPVGYVATRIYGNLKDPEKQCLYTCKIFDGGSTPRFEIMAEGEPEVATGRSVDDLHTSLMERINTRVGTQVVYTRGKGSQFFGLKHPSVQSLIQATAFRHQKLDLTASIEEENDAAVSFKSLQRSIAFSRSHPENYSRESITIGSILL